MAENDEYHLYEIFDKNENITFKYGISSEPLNKDGSSPRANKQANLFNRVAGKVRFIANVIKTKIKGERKAKELENEYIDKFTKKNGKPPRGNPTRNKL